MAAIARMETDMNKIAKWLMRGSILLLAVAAAHADWPVFHGNLLQSGTLPEGVVLPDKLEVLWKVSFKEGDIESTAAILGDTVYIGTFDSKLYALDLATGKEKWKYEAADTIKAPVAAADGAVYVGDSSGEFHCVDARNGKLLWKYATNGEIQGGACFAGDNVLIGSYDNSLYCLDKKKGTVTWQFKTKGPVNGSALVSEKLNLTFVAGCDCELHIVDLKKGIKACDAVALNGGAAGATAAVRDDKLYVGTMGNELFEIDLMKKGITWTFSDNNNTSEFYSSPAVTNELVIVGNRNGKLYAVKRKDGTSAWTFTAKKRIDSSPVVAGGNVYVGCNDGHLYVVDLAKGTLNQKIQLGRSILASPAVSQNRLVIGTTDGHLYCLGKKDEQK